MHGDTARSPIVAAVVAVAALALSPAFCPGVAAAAPALRAPARTPCTTLPSPPVTIADPPYAQARFDPTRLASLATGSGITVAVIDSGVDVQHPQLAGKVKKGMDALRGGPDGHQDCNGHGTGVASLIVAGRPADGSTPAVDLRGLAPSASILPVRVSEQTSLSEDDRDGITDAKFAEAIRFAADNAQVINMSLAMIRDSPAVKSAVEYARRKDVVIVAAVGNEAENRNPKPFPAAYDGVIGVGAIDQSGFRAPFSQHGDYVDVVAPGVSITMAAVGGGYLYEQGTSFASPFVAATAALLRERFPSMTADEVARRIMATADPSPGGVDTSDYGTGVVNPYRALTDSFAPPSTRKPAPVVLRTEDPAVVAMHERRDDSRRMAFIVAGAGAGAAVVAILVALVLPRGLRRRWRPAEPS